MTAEPAAVHIQMARLFPPRPAALKTLSENRLIGIGAFKSERQRACVRRLLTVALFIGSETRDCIVYLT